MHGRGSRLPQHPSRSGRDCARGRMAGTLGRLRRQHATHRFHRPPFLGLPDSNSLPWPPPFFSSLISHLPSFVYPSPSHCPSQSQTAVDLFRGAHEAKPRPFPPTRLETCNIDHPNVASFLHLTSHG